MPCMLLVGYAPVLTSQNVAYPEISTYYLEYSMVCALSRISTRSCAKLYLYLKLLAQACLIFLLMIVYSLRRVLFRWNTVRRPQGTRKNEVKYSK